MGLDMYLSGKKYVKNWNHTPIDKKHTIIVKQGDKEITSIFPITYITYEVGYWRKANQIHNWFVNNIQEGVDDCKSYYVEIEQLKELRDLVEKVLADHKLADELLPNTPGFFFGSTEYDKYYFEDLEETKEILDKIIENDTGLFEYEYYSSW